MIVFFQPTMSVLATRGTMFGSSTNQKPQEKRLNGNAREEKNGDIRRQRWRVEFCWGLKLRREFGSYLRLRTAGQQSLERPRLSVTSCSVVNKALSRVNL